MCIRDSLEAIFSETVLNTTDKVFVILLEIIVLWQKLCCPKKETLGRVHYASWKPPSANQKQAQCNTGRAAQDAKLYVTQGFLQENAQYFF